MFLFYPKRILWRNRLWLISFFVFACSFELIIFIRLIVCPSSWRFRDSIIRLLFWWRIRFLIGCMKIIWFIFSLYSRLLWGRKWSLWRNIKMRFIKILIGCCHLKLYNIWSWFWAFMMVLTITDLTNTPIFINTIILLVH